MIAYALISIEDLSAKKPKSYSEALKSSNNREWMMAMSKNMDFIKTN